MSKYKIIMYMYRFNTEKGFLFHPVRSDSENMVSLSTYNIPRGRGGKLHKVGICIPQSEDGYGSFKKAIGEREKAFKEKIAKLVGGDDWDFNFFLTFKSKKILIFVP